MDKLNQNKTFHTQNDGIKIRDQGVIKFDNIKKLTWKMSFFQYSQSVNLVLKDKKTIKIKEFSMFSPAPYFDLEIIGLINALNKHDIPTIKFSQSSAAELQKLIIFIIISIIFVEMFFKSSLFKW